MDTPDGTGLNLGNLPPGVARVIIQMEKPENRNKMRLISRQWSELVDETYEDMSKRPVIMELTWSSYIKKPRTRDGVPEFVQFVSINRRMKYSNLERSVYQFRSGMDEAKVFAHKMEIMVKLQLCSKIFMFTLKISNSEHGRLSTVQKCLGDNVLVGIVKIEGIKIFGKTFSRELVEFGQSRNTLHLIIDAKVFKKNALRYFAFNAAQFAESINVFTDYSVTDTFSELPRAVWEEIAQELRDFGAIHAQFDTESPQGMPFIHRGHLSIEST